MILQENPGDRPPSLTDGACTGRGIALEQLPLVITRNSPM